MPGRLFVPWRAGRHASNTDWVRVVAFLSMHSQLSQVCQVGSKGLQHGGMFAIDYAILLASLLYEPAYLRIVNVTYSRE